MFEENKKGKPSKEDAFVVHVAPPKNPGGDEADQAQVVIDHERDVGVQKILKLIPKSLPEDFDGHCVDCGEPIPEARLKLFFTTCVECQTIREKKQRK